MEEWLRERILRRLETLPENRLYQVLDYLEFLESKYARRAVSSASVLQRFTEGVEDTLRAGRVSAATIGETMGLLNRAMGVLSGVAAAGKSVAADVAGAATRQGPRAREPRANDGVLESDASPREALPPASLDNGERQ